MSDPVTNVEIEDVLSSIRRLVSDGDKARTRDPAPDQSAPDQTAPDDATDVPHGSAKASEGGDSAAKPDKFVLTPALMIVGKDDAAATQTVDTEQDSTSSGPALVSDGSADAAHSNAEASEAEFSDAAANETPDTDDLPGVLRLGDADAAVRPETEESALQDQPDNVTPTDTSRDNADAMLASDDESDGDSGDDQGDLAEDMEDVVWGSVEDARQVGLAAVPLVPPASQNKAANSPTHSEAEASAAATPSRANLVATIAELEAAVSADVQDFEPDGSEEASDVMGETIAWPRSVARDLDAVEDAEEDSAAHNAPVEDANQGADAGPQGATETEKLADTTADGSGDSPTEVEADVPFAHRPLGEATGADNAADSGANSTADKNDRVADTEDDYGDDDLADLDGDLDSLLDVGGVTLDEDALRDLVAEVVRSELTGPLGERITRNVRKLVRREIYRILSSQEFD